MTAPIRTNKRRRSISVNLSEALRAWRRRRNLSQTEAGLELQISARTLQEWEQGRAVPQGIALLAVQKLIKR